MEDLFVATPSVQPFSYPVIMTVHENGEVELNSPDFPNVSYIGPDMQTGLQLVKDQISEETLMSAYIPTATPPLAQNQYLLQVSV